MKWGRKKISSEPSSSRNSLISHVFPVSWLSKFKQKSGDPVKVKQEGKRNLAFGGSPKCVSTRGGRFYGGEGDAFWRLSFGEEGDRGKTSRGDLSSVWYDPDNKLDVPPSVCQSCGSNATTTIMGNEEIQKFNMIVDARKMKELQRNAESFPEMEIFETEEEAVTKTLRMTTKERKFKKINQRNPKEQWSKLERYPNEAEEKSRKSFENDNLEFETIPNMERENCKLIRDDLKKHRYISSSNLSNSNLTTVEEDDVLAFQNLNGNYGDSAEKISSEWEKLKVMKMKEIKSKNESQRKSLYVSRELQTRKTKQNSKVKVGSPRIKALEDMKKAKLKLKKGKEKTIDGRTSLESLAVVKCSFDPQKDFRDSMIEMILEKRFSRPEELEELLACYLTLNSDEYHDLIIKVFRQVWFELNQACFDELQDEQYCHY